MAAHRTLSLKALRKVHKASNAIAPRRGLHITQQQDAPRLANPTKQPVWKISGLSKPTPCREFNTTRELKMAGDSSTIDYCYLPKLFEERYMPEPTSIRVPILPHVESDDAEARLEDASHIDHAAGGYQDTDKMLNVMEPEISTMLHNNEQSVSTVSDVHDGYHPTEMSVEVLTQLNETVSKSAKKLIDGMKDKDEDALRQIWNNLFNDVFGKQPKTA